MANLPPVSTTPMANFATSFASVVDTGVNETSGHWPPVSTTLAANATGVNDTGDKWEQYQAAETLK